jgi:hypothetical protein
MTRDYMTIRSENIAVRSAGKVDPDALARYEALRCLSRDVLLRVVANPEMADAPAAALASRSVALAECLLAELGKVEMGEEISEAENMMEGTLFGLFRQMYYQKRAAPEGAGE